MTHRPPAYRPDGPPLVLTGSLPLSLALDRGYAVRASLIAAMLCGGFALGLVAASQRPVGFVVDVHEVIRGMLWLAFLTLAWVLVTQLVVLVRRGPGLVLDDAGLEVRTGLLVRRLPWSLIGGAAVLPGMSLLHLEVTDVEEHLASFTPVARIVARRSMPAGLLAVDCSPLRCPIATNEGFVDDLARRINAEVARRTEGGPPR